MKQFLLVCLLMPSFGQAMNGEAKHQAATDDLEGYDGLVQLFNEDRETDDGKWKRATWLVKKNFPRRQPSRRQPSSRKLPLIPEYSDSDDEGSLEPLSSDDATEDDNARRRVPVSANQQLLDRLAKLEKDFEHLDASCSRDNADLNAKFTLFLQYKKEHDRWGHAPMLRRCKERVDIMEREQKQHDRTIRALCRQNAQKTEKIVMLKRENTALLARIGNLEYCRKQEMKAVQRSISLLTEQLSALKASNNS